MTVQDIVKRCEERTIRLWCEGDRLRFRAPDGMMDASLAAELRERKADLITWLRSDGEQTFETYPLSQGQKAFLFLNQMAPESSAYNVGFGLRIRSTVDFDALRLSFQALIDRHGSLRTVFTRDEAGEYWQQVYVYRPVSFNVNTVTEKTDDEIDVLIDMFHRTPFDIEHGPLFRIEVFEKSDHDAILIISAHHLVADGLSFWILLDELKTLYPAFSQGGPLPQSPQATTYPDYVRWQQSLLDGPDGDRHWEFWKSQLHGSVPLTGLHTDHPRPTIQSFSGDSLIATIDAGLTSRLRELARQEGVTLFVLILAIFEMLLYRYSGQTDFCIGTPVAGRPTAEFQGVVGLFTNPVVLRAVIDPATSFRSYLATVRTAVYDAIDHQDYPLRLLAEKLRKEAGTDNSPLFTVDYVLQKPQRAGELTEIMQVGDDSQRIAFGGLEIELYPVHQQEGQLDITLEVVESDRTLLATMKYSTDLFEPSTIDGLMTHFMHLIGEVTGNPDRTIASTPLVLPEEHDRLRAWGSTEPVHAGPETVVDLFDRQAAQTPDVPAVCCREAQLSYREVNEQADRLAAYLIAEGLAVGTPVAVCLDRSVDMVVAFWGILKAGGVYLPVSPAHPADRIQYQLADAGARWVVTQDAYAVMFPDIRVVVVDHDLHMSADISEEASRRPTGSDIAYIIYTSGSTGQPKGVVVRHAGLATICHAWDHTYRLRERTSVHLQMAANTFDVFIGDMVRALCTGAKLVVTPRELLLDPERLYRLMSDQRVDCAEFVPVVLRGLLTYLGETGQDLSFMQVVVVGSDRWTMDEYRALRSLCSEQAMVVNSYGLTEATIDSTYCESPSPDIHGDQPVPIGKPFPGSLLCVLDANMLPVPIGVPGEVYIGGPGLADGYLHQPELTREMFVEIDTGDGQCTRFFRTGDRGRYLPDGSLTLLGRTDSQVKIRGFRVDTGEIESVLQGHPQVRQAAVCARTEESGAVNLIAYVVLRGTDDDIVSQLREWCKETLPDYMIPKWFETLELIPLTASGKIDHRALPAPSKKILSGNGEYRAPRTETEQALADIWKDVLHIEQVGVTDNFFDSGGHSLLATQVVSRIKQSLGVHFPLRFFFQDMTIAGMAAYIDKSQQIRDSFASPSQDAIGNREEIIL